MSIFALKIFFWQFIIIKIEFQKEAEKQETIDNKEKDTNKKTKDDELLTTTKKEKVIKIQKDKQSQVRDQTKQTTELECSEQSLEKDHEKAGVASVNNKELISDNKITEGVRDDLLESKSDAKYTKQKSKIMRSSEEYSNIDDQEVVENISDQQKPRSSEISTHKEPANKKAVMNVRSEVIDLPELESKTFTFTAEDKRKEALKSKHKLNRELSVIESPIQGESVDVDTGNDLEQEQLVHQKAKLTKNEQRKLSRVENTPRLEALDIAIDATDVHVLDTNTKLDIKPKKIEQKVTERIQSDAKSIGVHCLEETTKDLKKTHYQEEQPSESIGNKLQNKRVLSIPTSQGKKQIEEISTDIPEKINEGTVASSSYEATNTTKAIKSANVIGMISQKEEIETIDKTYVPEVTIVGHEPNYRRQLQLNSKEVVDTSTDCLVPELSNTYPKEESANLSSTVQNENNRPVCKPVELKQDEIIDQVHNLDNTVSLQTKANIKTGNIINNPIDKEYNIFDECPKELGQQVLSNKRAKTINETAGRLEKARSVEKRIGQDFSEQDVVDLKINKVDEQRASSGKYKKEVKQRTKSSERMVGIDIPQESTEELISIRQSKIRADEKFELDNKALSSKTSHSMVAEDISDSVSQFEVSNLEQKTSQSKEKANNKQLSLKKPLSLVDDKKEESVRELDISQPMTTLDVVKEIQNKDIVVKKSIPVVDDNKEESIQDLNITTPWFLKQAKSRKDQELKSIATKKALPVGDYKHLESTEIFEENIPTKDVKVTIEETKVKKGVTKIDHQTEENEEKLDTCYEKPTTAMKSKTIRKQQQALNVPKLIGVRVKCNLMH